VILDSNGAEKLLGHGDMLYVSPTKHQMVRAQGAFVSEDETHAVVEYIETHGPNPDFIPDLVQTETAKKKGMAERDDLYDQAVEVILGQQRGSATLIQRALAVGYTRATRLLEMMEEDGVVGPFVGSKSRDVLMTLEEWQAREAAIEEELAALDGAEGDEFEDEIEDEDPEAELAGDEAEPADGGEPDGGEPDGGDPDEEDLDDEEFEDADPEAEEPDGPT
jgi:S-DNA-T family DNA segregation ATPase FtsK/SpoIIIE